MNKDYDIFQRRKSKGSNSKQVSLRIPNQVYDTVQKLLEEKPQYQSETITSYIIYSLLTVLEEKEGIKIDYP